MLKKYSIGLLWNCDSFKGESLILIKADDYDDFQNFFQQQLIVEQGSYNKIGEIS